MKKTFTSILILLAACNNPSGGHKESTNTNDASMDTSGVKQEPVIKKEYYPDSSIFREINLSTLDAKIYTNDGKLFLKGQFRDENYVLYGVWEEWDRIENYKRFELTYDNNIENGPFKSFRKDGSLYATGIKRAGSFDDTLKYYDNDGKVFEMQIWKPDVSKTGGTSLAQTINLTDMRSDGTTEKIKGKMYIWKDGKRTLMKK